MLLKKQQLSFDFLFNFLIHLRPRLIDHRVLKYTRLLQISNNLKQIAIVKTWSIRFLYCVILWRHRKYDIVEFWSVKLESASSVCLNLLLCVNPCSSGCKSSLQILILNHDVFFNYFNFSFCCVSWFLKWWLFSTFIKHFSFHNVNIKLGWSFTFE